MLFWVSLKFFSWQEIRNTFDISSSYFKYSNKVNRVFYPLFLIVFIVWAFIMLIQ
jgi:hypothetical protein